jgi:hypothetical protein
MSALTPLPPDVEKMWITVDKAGFMWVVEVISEEFN